MTTTPALTGRDIGQAENAIRALLDQLIGPAGLSYPEWTVLFALDSAGPLSNDQLVQQQADGLKITEAAAQATVDSLRSANLLAPVDEPPATGEHPRLDLTEAAEAVFRPARQGVARIAQELYGGLPQDDLEATHRTLAEVTRRAGALLASNS